MAAVNQSENANMANPTLTAEALRNLISEVVAETLGKRSDSAGRNLLPKADRTQVNYDALTTKAFKKAGFGEVTPRVDVLTFNRWVAAGFRPKEGEKAVKVKQFRLFHKSQVRELTEAERAASQPEEAKAAKAKPVLTSPKAKAAKPQQPSVGG